MSLLDHLRQRLHILFRRERSIQHLDDELQFHLDQQTAENIAAGMNQQEARYAASRIFGNRTLVNEDARAAWGWDWLEHVLQDLRFAFRQLAKTPGFTATVILTLALGIGANAAIFTLVHAVLLKNLPVGDPENLIRLGDSNDCCVASGTTDSGDYSLFSTATYELLRSNLPEFEDLAGIQAGFAYRPVTVRRGRSLENARSVMGEFVSGNYFRTFGLHPHAGRLFTDEDDRKGAPTVAVMSYEAWKRIYASDLSVIGGTFFVNTQPVTVAGVAPKGFYGDRLAASPPEFYLPIESMPAIANVPYVHDPETSWLYFIGRLKPGVSLPALQQKVSALVEQSLAQTKMFSSDENKKLLPKTHVVLTPGSAGILSMRSYYAANLRLLQFASGIVLLIACANIANLLLVRGTQRKLEISIRSALGAPRGRIVRQLLTESLLLAVVGGLAGLLLAYVGASFLLSGAFPAAVDLPIDARPSFEILAFATGLSLLTAAIFGVAPAWIAAKTEPADALRTGTRGTASGASLLQRTLVITQAALSLVLLVTAGLFSQSLNKLQSTDLKLDSRNRYIVHINPQAAGCSQRQLEALYRTIEQRFHALPGIVSVGLSTYTPMEDNNWGSGIQIQGQPVTKDPAAFASFVKVTPEYFDSVGTNLIMGRLNGPQDTPASHTVAVVNESFAKGFFHSGTSALGQHFGGDLDSAGDFEIVGVVQDSVYQTVRWKDHRMYFVPMMQRPASDKDPIEKDSALYAGALALHTQAPIANMEQLARQTLSEINPNLAVVKFQTFDQQIADQFSDDRLVARITALFGGLALLLATIGLYGLTAYTVARRTSEIGIRMALGANPAGVTGMVLRGALQQTLIGLLIGVPVALLCVRFVESQLYETKGMDYTVLLIAILTLAAASALAGFLPARRAALTDPAQTLRAE
jgi:macrolide transport system ATP-binding/permease protein